MKNKHGISVLICTFNKSITFRIGSRNVISVAQTKNLDIYLKLPFLQHFIKSDFLLRYFRHGMHYTRGKARIRSFVASATAVR
jgi:hypothetical protein